MSLDDAIWLNKFISESGFCSRREADKFILAGQVTTNGVVAQKGDQIKKNDKVRINGLIIKPRKEDEIVFIALNKPVGIVSTTENVRDNIVQFVNHPVRIFPIGRLDKDSQGLIFLTNNGDIVNKILRAGNNHEKEYIVTVHKAISDATLSDLGKGVPIMGTVTKKCKVTRESAKSFRITLIQGLNRQIRRMCEYFGFEVLKLERVRIMNIRLKGIPLGEWRDLTDEEMEEINGLTQDSSSDYSQTPEIESVSTKATTPERKFDQKGLKKFSMKAPRFDSKSSKPIANRENTDKASGKTTRTKFDTKSNAGESSFKSFRANKKG